MLDENQILVNSLREQFAAGLLMLKKVIDICPEHVWNDSTKGNPFWVIAHHALYYVDWYLSISTKERNDFAPEFPEYRNGATPSEDTFLNKDQIVHYYEKVLRKAKTQFNRISSNDLLSPSIFEWHGISMLSSFIYNIRHLMIHTGTLNLRIYQAGLTFESWESHQNFE